MVRFSDFPDKIIVYFTDAKILDESQAQEARKGLLDICRRAVAEGKKLIVDLRGVQFVSSAMIGSLVLVSSLARANEIDVRLCNIAPSVMEVFRITRLHKVFGFGADDGPDMTGCPVPNPRRPPADNTHAQPPVGNDD